jgi:chromosome partitioning protein
MQQESANTTLAPVTKKAHIIIVGNEKGGCGKTTTTMHLIIALLRLGFSVGCIDLDSRQRSLTRYVENRRQTIAKEGISLPMPRHCVVNKSPFDSQEEAKKDEKERFAQALAAVFTSCDFVVIDTPGNDTYLSRLAHSFADTIITPINDSFVDLDVLASVDGRTLEIIKPSIYSEIVWEQKLQRAKRDGGSIDWIVMRNRLSNIDAKNKRFMAKVTDDLARRIGFRAAPGFSERVIFRELFLQGLTVLDVMDADANIKISISHIAARQEVRDLLKILAIDAVTERLEKLRLSEEAEESGTNAASSSADVKEEQPSVVQEAPTIKEEAAVTAEEQPAIVQEKTTPKEEAVVVATPFQSAIPSSAPTIEIPKLNAAPKIEDSLVKDDSFSFSPARMLEDEAMGNGSSAAKLVNN